MSETVAKSLEPRAEASADTTKNLFSKSGAETFQQTFDRNAHQPFRLDPRGMNKEVTLKEFSKGVKGQDEVRIPDWWKKGDKTCSNRTLTDLQQNRRKNLVPDKSFDLDGDGIVGNRDLVISKLFDKDGDGKLNAQERAAADEAIRNGIDKKMVWNVDQSGPQRSYRIMQKRGVIVDADDFLPIRSTYPEHPLSKHEPKAKTFGDLKDQRSNSNRQKIDVSHANFEDRLSRYTKSINQPYVYSEFNKGNQRFSSVNERREFERQEARKKQNLTDVMQDQKDEVKAPTLAYVDKPKIPSKTILQEQRRQEMLNELKQMERNVGNHADSYARMNDRENCALRLLSNMPPSKMTRQQLDQKRRAEMVADNTSKFGTVTVGIHGGELPSFQGESGSKEWWRLQHAKKEDPQIQSRLLLKQTQQFWAKNDASLLADVQFNLPPQDPFKQTHVPKQGFKDVPTKVNLDQHCPDSALMKQPDVSFGYRNKTRWSQKTQDKRCYGDDRTFDKIIAGSVVRENIEVDRERKLKEYFAQPQRGTIRGRMDGNQGQVGDILISQNEQPTSKLMSQAGNAGQITKPTNTQPFHRSVSHLDHGTIDTQKQADSTTEQQSKTLINSNTSDGQLQFGFVKGGNMKQTLFSRMSPTNKLSGAQNSAIGDVQKVPRTQASSSNVQPGSTMQTVGSSVTSPTTRGVPLQGGAAAARNGKSPFREAMQKGVLSGAGLLTF